jgi:polysaccharide deacetylase 2 family uncharacterized protein YibQ
VPIGGYLFNAKLAETHSRGHTQKKRKRDGSAIPYRKWIFPVAFFAILTVSLFVIAYLKNGNQTKSQVQLAATTTTTITATSSTVWPHGSPEYKIELPPGYEGLLVDRSLVTQRKPTTEKAPGKVLSPTLIIVIDDAGYNLKELAPFLKLPFPITVAVLPGVPHTRDSAQLILEAGKELILHQPMQAIGGNNPGPGVVDLSMSQAEIADIVQKNLDEMPEAVGINNHMGSAFTRDAAAMRTVLRLVKERGIYYLDSLTTTGTATAAVCKELKLPLWERDVFLDNVGDKESIVNALEEGKRIARNRGAAVMIGHVWSASLAQTLMDIYPQLVEQGYSLSTISQFMLAQASQGDYNSADPGH